MSDHAKLVQLRDAAKVLGVSYSTLKRWIHTRKIQTVKTQGGHHRIPESELDKHLHFAEKRMPLPQRRAQFRRISAQPADRPHRRHQGGWHHGPGHTVDRGQQITSVITADAVRELRLEKGQVAAALIKSTEVMILRV